MEESHHDPCRSLEGQKFFPRTPQEVEEVIELAFDYRGDITLEIKTGERIEGYIFDRDSRKRKSVLKIFPKGQHGSREIFYHEVMAVFFSGEDTAFGKSWEEKMRNMGGNNP
jgi:transcriptional antiterminator Rof (Rho-off)